MSRSFCYKLVSTSNTPFESLTPQNVVVGQLVFSDSVDDNLHIYRVKKINAKSISVMDLKFDYDWRNCPTGFYAITIPDKDKVQLHMKNTSRTTTTIKYNEDDKVYKYKGGLINIYPITNAQMMMQRVSKK